MEINVRTNISKEFNSVEIMINAPKKTEQVIEIENALLNLNSEIIKEVIGNQGNNLYILNVSNVVKFYSDEKKTYCKTPEGVFIIKEKLYYLEEKLPSKSFIRISNSVIVNINKVKCFNTDVIGSVLVKMVDGTEEYVSKRRISSVMKFLKDRRG